MADTRTAMQKVFSFDTAMLLVRICLGLVFMFHGGQKMFGWFGGRGWEATVKGFAGMGIPEPLAIMVPITEFVGGACIVVGLLSRFWAAGLAIVMINAIALVHFKDGWHPETGQWLGLKALWTGTKELGTSGIESQTVLLLVSLAVFFGGPGGWAVADLEGWLLGLRRRPPA